MALVLRKDCRLSGGSRLCGCPVGDGVQLAADGRGFLYRVGLDDQGMHQLLLIVALGIDHGAERAKPADIECLAFLRVFRINEVLTID